MVTTWVTGFSATATRSLANNWENIVLLHVILNQLFLHLHLLTLSFIFLKNINIGQCKYWKNLIFVHQAKSSLIILLVSVNLLIGESAVWEGFWKLFFRKEIIMGIKDILHVN